MCTVFIVTCAIDRKIDNVAEKSMETGDISVCVMIFPLLIVKEIYVWYFFVACAIDTKIDDNVVE